MKPYLMIIAAAVMLSACTPGKPIKSDDRNADYWQRTEAVESLYLTGPKAQHQLNKDIAACVAEVKELVRLGSIKSAQPPENITMNRSMRSGWNSVTRDGPLYTEYTDFQDFEECMEYKGWGRMHYVTPTQKMRGHRNYNETIMGEHYGGVIISDRLPQDDQFND